MIGLLVACGTVAVAIVATVLVAKYPPSMRSFRKADGQNVSLARWATLLDGLSRPASEDYSGASAWDIGAPVQPAEFTRQLGSLQGALARAQESAVAVGEDNH
jgi:hypothetical protein